MKTNPAIIALALLFMACSQDFMPKPRGYNRIELPEPEYVALSDSFPYFFEHSIHAQVLKDTSWLSEPYWVDLYYPYFDATVQLTYKPVNRDSLFESYFNDSYRLTSKHNVKAYAIEEQMMVTQSGHVAIISELEGEVPSTFQFHTTDSTRHFLRGALYFKTSTKNDSLAPSIAFIKNDLFYLLNTLEWRD